MLDLSKAFDRANHEVLVCKLEESGVRNAQLKLLRSYLSNRYQKVLIRQGAVTQISSEMIVPSGVPQGSILGPLLFVVYINDMPQFMSLKHGNLCVPLIYADDTVLTFSSNSTENIDLHADEILVSFREWCGMNDLILNTVKTECIIFSHVNSSSFVPPMLHHDGDIKVQDSAKFLGVQLDSHLRWRSHVDIMSGKLNKAFYCLLALKSQISFETLRMVYLSCFQGIYSYAIIFWGNASTNVNIFKLQKKAIRVILNLRYRESCRGGFRRLGVLTMHGMYAFKLLQFVFGHPNYFEEHRNRNYTRRVMSFFYPRHQTSVTERNCLYMGIKLFNSLPRKIQQITDPKNFRTEIFKIIMECEPYSIDELLEYCRVVL
ncbi:hypothetical protein WA026_015687 [Henosepilachna vigintioctopunctata]|uniref:Reverse transcriptase domain-containing protein n=1 Tax=Henosepilachna vigintioctopunctata TaxID=420089 RepID=A0AAW1UZ73_9CUCU